MSIWASAIKEAPIAVTDPIAIRATEDTGERVKTGCISIGTYAPADTTIELGKIPAGLGPSIASSSHKLRGN